MPDHVHLFVRGPDNFQLGPSVGRLKQALAKKIALTPTVLIWQRGFFNHVLRNNEKLRPKMELRPRESGSRGFGNECRRLALFRRDRGHRSRITVAVALRATLSKASLYEA